MVKEQITPEDVRQMFELDFSESKKGTAMSREDMKFYETVENGITCQEDLHYEMSLPFKHWNIRLPNNYPQAEKRLMLSTTRITAALCLKSSPRDMHARWIWNLRVKVEESGICHIMESTTRRNRRKCGWCLIVQQLLKVTPWMINYLSDQVSPIA